VHESAILNYPIGRVWDIIRPFDFIYLPTVATVRLEGKDAQPDTVGTERVIFYQDGTKQHVRLLELSDSRNAITWELVQSEPAAKALSAVHTVRLRRVTDTNHTYIEWITDFSKDATHEVIEDCRYKQRENFAAMRKDMAKKFTFRSSAEQAIKGWEGKGKVVFITGANSGIGLECARVFLNAGAHVIACCRSPKQCDVIFAPLAKQAPPSAKLDVLELDLNSLKSVRKAAETFLAMKLPLHILLLNAGIMAIPERTPTEEKLESQFGVNHVAHHLLGTLLLDTLVKSAPARVVTVTSAGHRFSGINFDDMNWEKSYDRWKAYGQSKTANILFAKQLNHICKSKGQKVEAFSVPPGSIKTSLGRSLVDEDVKRMTAMPYRWKDVGQGAATSVVACTDADLNGKGGIYMVDCNEVTPVAWAADMQAAARLWEETEKIIAKHK
jgi:NAD(P)-dependent dehydrogenase (short-subunit alcohol dehydrogenase family)